jgi:hypothetical protein
LNSYKTPILFLIFNRLTTSQQVFAAICQAQPAQLYIASDGPRPQVPEEDEKVKAVRNYVVNHIDWDCQVHTLFREENLGCRLAVSSAIDWFFEYESEGIILEDDCLPDASFFRYAEELLSHYRHDKRIMAISGLNIFPSLSYFSHSYCFSHYPYCWGWATWKRAWQYYDVDIDLWTCLRDTNWLLAISGGSQSFQNYWSRAFNQAYENKIDTWDFQWFFCCWAQHGLAIMPSCNLVENIGFDQNATHTKSSNTFLEIPKSTLPFPLAHPPFVVRDDRIDSWVEKHVFSGSYSIYKRLKNRFKKLFD